MRAAIGRRLVWPPSAAAARLGRAGTVRRSPRTPQQTHRRDRRVQLVRTQSSCSISAVVVVELKKFTSVRKHKSSTDYVAAERPLIFFAVVASTCTQDIVSHERQTDGDRHLQTYEKIHACVPTCPQRSSRTRRSNHVITFIVLDLFRLSDSSHIRFRPPSPNALRFHLPFSCRDVTFRVRRLHIAKATQRTPDDRYTYNPLSGNRDRVSRRLIFSDFFFPSRSFCAFFSLPVITRRRLGTPAPVKSVQNWPHQAESGSCGHWRIGRSARLGEFFSFF